MRSLPFVLLPLLPALLLAPFSPSSAFFSPPASVRRAGGISTTAIPRSPFLPTAPLAPLYESTDPDDDAEATIASAAATKAANNEPSTDATSGPSTASLPPEPGSHSELLYALGVNLARQIGDVRPLVESGTELTLVARGLLDTVTGRLDEDGQAKLLTERRDDLNGLVTERATKIRDRLMEAGKEMLKEMSETEGVQELTSGVMLHVIDDGPEEGQSGGGTRPTKSSTVRVHYHGTLPDGAVFDSTLGDDEPVTFALGQVIPGWRDALLKMHEGQTAMVGIPPDQGYGDMGSPDGRIPGGATLFFKVQLLEVLTAGIGGSPTLLGADGTKLKKKDGGGGGGSGLLGVDGRPL